MFRSIVDRLDDLNKIRLLQKKALTFGNAFLDDCFGGLYPDDLVVVTARTGGGKTELVSQIAQENVLNDKKIHLFALEAHYGEIEARIKFKMLSQAFYIQKDWRSYNKIPNYQEWYYGKQEDILCKFEPEIDEDLKKTMQNLNTYYRHKEFNIEEFEMQMAMIGKDTDLVIVDHLHYFDLDTKKENENEVLKKTIKQIKDLTMFYRIPTILVVHIRKQDKRVQGILPDIEDIHGSSDITKIGTKIIATAPAKDQISENNSVWPTYFGILKNRMDGSRCNYIGLCGFDTSRNKYAKKYKLGRIDFKTGEFQEIEKHDYPRWAYKQSSDDKGTQIRMGEI